MAIQMSERTTKVINFIIHAFIAFIFLTMMFIFVISWQEEKHLQRQINALMSPPPGFQFPTPPPGPTLPPTPITLPPGNSMSIYDIYVQILNDVSPEFVDAFKDQYSDVSQVKTINNNWLLAMSITVCLLLCLIPFTMLSTIKYSCGGILQFNKNILAYNGLVVLFVISFEVFFIFVIGTQYIPINPVEFTNKLTNNVKDLILEELRK